MRAPHTATAGSAVEPAVNPLSITVDRLEAMLNFELADHPVYDGAELQWFDDDVHGTGMLVFLSRRSDRRVDHYVQRGLRLDRAGYELGGGTGTWTTTDFEVARLEVAADGVDAEVRFDDVAGRRIEIRVDDRDGRPRRRGGLLAPVGAAIERPTSLLLVWMPAFDLVRVSDRPPIIRIDGHDAATGHLPWAWLHRRHLIKYAAPVISIQLNRAQDGPLAIEGGTPVPAADRRTIDEVAAEHDGHIARLILEPPLPSLTTLTDGAVERGRWHVRIGDVRLTGGTWSGERHGDRVVLELEVRERWRPGALPWLMRLVTTVMPVFRRWPTTYRWRADLTLTPPARMTSRWERTASDLADDYRRATSRR